MQNFKKSPADEILLLINNRIKINKISLEKNPSYFFRMSIRGHIEELIYLKNKILKISRIIK